MQRVTGIGGIFFKSKNPKALGAWYKTHLGIDVQSWGGAAFEWSGQGTTAWSLFPADTKKFTPSAAPFMVNYRVADLHALLAALRSEGVHVEEKVEDTEYGKFGWVIDPEGNKIELWQPPEGQ
jgi:predicted enzyme related to lactoylglutathione lyase